MKFLTIQCVLAFLTAVATSAQADSPPANVGQACGGIAGARCTAGLYCDFGDATKTKPSSCGKGDIGGKCAKIPEACPRNTKNISYVCGCDGKTYTNACEAHRQGVTSGKLGRCDVKP